MSVELSLRIQDFFSCVHCLNRKPKTVYFINEVGPLPLRPNRGKRTSNKLLGLRSPILSYSENKTEVKDLDEFRY